MCNCFGNFTLVHNYISQSSDNTKTNLQKYANRKNLFSAFCTKLDIFCDFCFSSQGYKFLVEQGLDDFLSFLQREATFATSYELSWTMPPF